MKRLLGNGLLVVMIGMLTACTSLSPVYTPAGLLHLDSASTAKLIRLRTIDEIQNMAPIAQQVSALQRTGAIVLMTTLGGVAGAMRASFTEVPKGAQWICPTCAYQLKGPPVNLVRDIAAAALAKGGVTIAEEAPRELYLRILRFEFVNTSPPTKVTVGAAILLRAEVLENGQTLADVAVLETAALDAGFAMTRGELQRFVGKTVSRTVERILVESQVRTALLGTPSR